MEGFDFHSDIDLSFWALKRYPLLTLRYHEAPGALVQSQLCFWFMLINNILWIRRPKFSAFWHTVHYFMAASLLVLYLPRHDWYKCMMDAKYAYTNMNIFIYQVVLGTIAGLTAFHQFLALLCTMTY